MKSKKYKSCISLNDQQYKMLTVLAQKNQTSKAEIIRRFIDEKLNDYIDYENNPFMKLGTFNTRTGVKDGSSNHDSYLYNQKG